MCISQLDAGVLREFAEKIDSTDVYKPDESDARVKVRGIRIVDHFIGVFD